MTEIKSNDNQQWLLLLGAIMVNKDLRNRATQVLADSDAPIEHRELWKAIKAGDGGQVRTAAAKSYFPLEASDKTCFDALLRNLQHASLRGVIKLAADQISTMKGVDADGMLHILESLSTKIRAKQAALENSKAPETLG